MERCTHRKKRVGRIERLVDHFGRNYRLEWVFRICKNLGIDDPCYWLDNTSSAVVDQWIAYEVFCESKESKSKAASTPEEALGILNTMAGTQ